MRNLTPLEKEMAVQGVSRSDVARAAGIDRSNVTHVLQGRRKSEKVIDTVSRLIHWPVQDVLRYIPQTSHQEPTHV